MKKLISFLLVICMLSTMITAFPIIANAATSGTCGDNLTWTLDDAGTLTISGTGMMTDYNRYSNCSPWYSSRSTIKSVVINYGVKHIGNYAFYECSSLTSITIPDGVTSIGDDAFYGCDNLTSITIPDGVTSIGDYAFDNCSSLTSITIPDGVTSIGDGAFSCCNNLTGITIPDGVTSIGNWTFYCCRSLTSITIPDGVTSIGVMAFSSCDNLTSITILGSVTSIGDGAFSCCNNLTGITIPDSVTSIGDEAFYSCRSLTSITIPDGVMSIGNWTFYECSSLTSITIPDSVTSIGDGAFGSCSSLTSITIPDGVTSIGDYAFRSCSSLTSITILGSVTSIGDEAFYSCRSLTSITIPDGVMSIGNWTFYGCGSLTSITIPDSVTSIGDDAFHGCGSLTSITIPDGVISIGDMAFYECSSLTSITIPDGVMSIGNWTFYGCGSLTSITIPDSVTSIGDDAFHGCGSLTSITILDGVTSIGDDAFYGCGSLTSITIPDSVTSIGDDAFHGCGSLTSITIPDGVTSIGDDAFSFCYNLTSITIPDSVTSIGNSVFEYCYRLTSITIPDGVTSIGDSAFSWCERLTSIYLPNDVTVIGNRAFFECRNLTDVYYTGSEEQWNNISIGSDNSDLTSATIHYNYGKTTNKNTDTNNENNSTITDRQIAHSIPSDINDDIVINRKGRGYGYVILHDKSGNVYANKSVSYSMTNEDGSFTEATGTTDVNGCIGITTPVFENNGTDVITKTVTAVFDNEDLQEDTFTFDVKITPISYKQSWSGTITAGAAASARQGVFSVGGSGEAAKDIALEEVYNEGKRDLHLTSAMDLEAAVNAKVGLYSGKNFLNSDAIDLGGASGKIGLSNKVGYGLYIEDYDPTDASQRLSIEAFLVDSILATGGSNTLPRILFDYYLDKRGITAVNEKTRDISLSMTGGLNAPEIKFGDFTASIGGISGKGEWTWGKSEDKDNVVTTTTSTECTADRKLFDIGYKKSFSGDGSIGTGTSIHSERFVNNLIELSGSYKDDEIKSIEFKSIEDYDISSTLTADSSTEYFKSITYEDEAAQAIAEENSFIKGLATGGFRLFGISSGREVYDLMSVSEHKGKYDRTKKHTDTYGKDFDIGISDEMGISFGISGSHTYSYKSQTGVIKDGFVYQNTRSNLDTEIRNNANTFEQVINPLLEGIKADLAETVTQIKGSVKEGIEWLDAKIKGAAEWTASIVSFDKNTVSLQSYDVLTVAEDAADISASSVSTTIGMPYIVSVKDSDGDAIDSFDENPLELTLSYNSEALAAAGLTNTRELLANMKIFRWSEETGVYVCAGGELDFENSCVTCSITKPGQYILAIDNCPPAVTALEVSGSSSAPKITAVIADLSGVSELNVAIDGNIVVDKTNFAQYYNSSKSAFAYEVKQPLSAGEHTVTIDAQDSLGNSTSEPYTLVFTVDDTAPVITNVAVPEFTDTTEIDVSASVRDDNISAVYAEVNYGGNVYSVEMMCENDVWTAKIDNLPKFAQLDVLVKAIDAAGNTAQSEKYTSTVAYSEKDSFYPGVVDFDGKYAKILVNNKSGSSQSAYLIVNAYNESGELVETVSQPVTQNDGYMIYDIQLATPCTRIRAELASQPDAAEYLATGFTAYSDIAEVYCRYDASSKQLVINSLAEYNDANIIICSYSNNQLADIELCRTQLKIVENQIKIDGFESSSGKIFVWDSKLKPIIKPVDFLPGV